MGEPGQFKLINPEKVPRRHGASLDLLFGGVIVRVEYDAKEGKLGFQYQDDETVLTRMVRHEKLRNIKIEQVCGKIGLLMSEVVGGLANDPKGLFLELPKKMKKILDGDQGDEPHSEEGKRE